MTWTKEKSLSRRSYSTSFATILLRRPSYHVGVMRAGLNLRAAKFAGQPCTTYPERPRPYPTSCPGQETSIRPSEEPSITALFQLLLYPMLGS